MLLILISITILFFSLHVLLQKKTQENYTGLITSEFIDHIKSKPHYKIDESKKTITYCKNGQCVTKSYEKHFNSMDGLLLAKNKIETSTLLSKNNIPVPKYMEIQVDESIPHIIQKMNSATIYYPIVLKPIHGTFGIDVMTNIESAEELKNNLQYFQEKGYSEIMLEEQIEGDCYRVFVFNNQVIDVIKREKPYVMGDSQHTVQELIDLRNKQQLKNKLFETKNVGELFLEKQGYRLDSIPLFQEKVYISNVINMHNGARIYRIDLNTIPKKNLDMFRKVNQVMNITCSGIDYLTTDITEEYDKNNSKILEVNGTPDTEIHTLLDSDQKENRFFEKIVNNIF